MANSKGTRINDYQTMIRAPLNSPGGLAALTQVYNAGQLEKDLYQGWVLIDSGIKKFDWDQIWQGNLALLEHGEFKGDANQ